MIFHAISKASLKVRFNIKVLSITLLSVLVVFAVAWTVGFVSRIRPRERGTFIQSSFHGNLGYIGLAIQD
jgi:hypothetical protein